MPIPSLSLFSDFSMYISTLVLALLLNIVHDSFNEKADLTESDDISMDISNIEAARRADVFLPASNSFTEKPTIAVSTVSTVYTDTIKLDYTTEASAVIWPNHTVFYSISSVFSPVHLQIISRVFDFIEEKTCIKFVAASKEQKKKYYLFIAGVGECSSQRGWMNAIRQKLVLKMDLIGEGCFVYGKLLQLMLRTLGYEGLSPSDYTKTRMGLKKKHLNKLNKMYHCFGGWEDE